MLSWRCKSSIIYPGPLSPQKMHLCSIFRKGLQTPQGLKRNVKKKTRMNSCSSPSLMREPLGSSAIPRIVAFWMVLAYVLGKLLWLLCWLAAHLIDGLIAVQSGWWCSITLMLGTQRTHFFRCNDGVIRTNGIITFFVTKEIMIDGLDAAPFQIPRQFWSAETSYD